METLVRKFVIIKILSEEDNLYIMLENSVSFLIVRL